MSITLSSMARIKVSEISPSRRRIEESLKTLTSFNQLSKSIAVYPSFLDQLRSSLSTRRSQWKRKSRKQRNQKKTSNASKLRNKARNNPLLFLMSSVVQGSSVGMTMTMMRTRRNSNSNSSSRLKKRIHLLPHSQEGRILLMCNSRIK